MSFRYELATLGAGNMAEGIIAAVVNKGLYPREAIVVADPVESRRKYFVERFGVAATEDNRQLVAQAKRIILAVKPQMFDGVAAGLADVVTAEHLLVSIMAGKSAAKIAAAFDAGRDSRGESAGKDSRRSKLRVVRVMPNLPISVGAGTAGIFGGEYATQKDVAEVKAIFDAGGSSVVVAEESLIDAVTSVSGSGPAYFYFFVEAMVEGGKACGLTEAEALSLAENTCLGAARMMLETGEPPADLRAKVTSKGGTTFAALEHMRAMGVDAAIRDAVKAAYARAKELGA